MKHRFTLLIITFLFINPSTSFSQDWADLSRFRVKNETMSYLLEGEQRVVFMGNSIFENWLRFDPSFFENESFVNRGISGQTTPQMLVRFRADVIDLKPETVLILAGTNDLAENTGPTTLKMILDNIFSMIQLAEINEIEVILCSILPTTRYPWNLYIKPAEKIEKLNIALKNYALAHNITYIDFYDIMKNEKKGLKKELTYDGVHPNQEGYSLMKPMIIEAISKSLQVVAD